jgi:hypothetical protein
MTWENHGVAPAYHRYDLRVQLLNISSGRSFFLDLAESDNRNWMPGRIVGEYYNLKLPALLPSGKYEIKIGLFYNNRQKEIPIQLALRDNRRSEDGYYKMGEILVR